MLTILLVPYLAWMAVLLLSLGNRKRPKLRLRGDAVPTVDVLFTTCGEVVPMIINTVRGACNIDYPRDRYRIIICDDDADPHLVEALQPLIREYPNLVYQARTKTPGVPHHYKAGNLQSGIDYAVTLPGGPAEYLATLDADMIPHPEWLRAILPHLLRDDELALVSPPQTFWNVPADDPLCQSICEFIHYLELRKDNMGCAWCTGSGVVFKRFIVDEMGGWPTPSMAEDQLLSFMMNGAGYKTAYLHEFMQVGMVPESIINRKSCHFVRVSPILTYTRSQATHSLGSRHSRNRTRAQLGSSRQTRTSQLSLMPTNYTNIPIRPNT
jgi:cellulose synthase/poly-beta-1,6-N-acetylglucosamine synthase-like glycosyltransferase